MTLGQPGLKGMRVLCCANAFNGSDIALMHRGKRGGAGGDDTVVVTGQVMPPSGEKDSTGSCAATMAVRLGTAQTNNLTEEDD